MHGTVPNGKPQVSVFDTYCPTLRMIRPAPMLEMIDASSASAKASLRSGLNATTSTSMEYSPAPTMATGSATRSPGATAYKPMKAPDMNTAPWAMFMMRWMPKIKVNPRANKAYTPPRTSPFKDSLRQSRQVVLERTRRRQNVPAGGPLERAYCGASTNFPSLTSRKVEP